MSKAKHKEVFEDNKPDDLHEIKVSPAFADLMLKASVPSTGDVSKTTTIHASQLAEGQRMKVEKIIQNLRMNLASRINLLPQDTIEPADLVRAVRCSPAAKFQDSPTPPYTGIFYDVKMSGEASHCPALRPPPPPCSSRTMSGSCGS